MVVAYDHLGWVPAVLILAVAVALPVWQIARFSEPRRTPVEIPTLRSGYAVLRILVRPGPVRRWALGVAPLFWVGIGIAYGLVTPMLVDAGWSLSRIGVTVNVVGSVVAVAGALASGVLTARRGLRWGLHVAATLQAAALIALLPLAIGHDSILLASVAVCLLELAFAVAATTAGATAMNLCRAGVAGAEYALVNSVALLVSFVAGAVGVALAGRLGYGPVLAGAAVVALASHLAVHWFWRAGGTAAYASVSAPR